MSSPVSVAPSRITQRRAEQVEVLGRGQGEAQVEAIASASMRRLVIWPQSSADEVAGSKFNPRVQGPANSGRASQVASSMASGSGDGRAVDDGPAPRVHEACPVSVARRPWTHDADLQCLEFREPVEGHDRRADLPGGKRFSGCTAVFVLSGGQRQ